MTWDDVGMGQDKGAVGLRGEWWIGFNHRYMAVMPIMFRTNP